MQPEIGPIKTFGVMFALAFLAVGAMCWRRYKELGKPTDYAYESVFCALIGGLVGARVYYLIQHPGEFGLSGIFSGSGLVFWGGAIGGIIGVLIWCWYRGMLNGYQLDMGGIGLAIGYSIGRIGCQLAGDGDYGTPTSLPWGMAYPKGTVPTNVDVHPTPIYETLSMGLVAWLLWTWRDKFVPGTVFGLYFIFAGVERFLVEFIRRNPDDVGGLTGAQLWSIASFLAGFVIIIICARRNGGNIMRVNPAPGVTPIEAGVVVGSKA
jgi:phosphatidylglycerol---prolipoprotein diacylglyceryl transferase